MGVSRPFGPWAASWAGSGVSAGQRVAHVAQTVENAVTWGNAFWPAWPTLARPTVGHPLTCENAPVGDLGPRILVQDRLSPLLTSANDLGPSGPP